MFKVTDYAAVMMIQAKICDFWPTDSCTSCLKSWADREGGQGVRNSPGKSQKYRFFQQYWSRTSEKKLASIQCWTIIGPPAKRHLNGVSLAGR